LYQASAEHAFVKASPFIDLLKCEYLVQRDEISDCIKIILFLLQSLPPFCVTGNLDQNSPTECTSKLTPRGRVLEKRVVSRWSRNS